MSHFYTEESQFFSSPHWPEPECKCNSLKAVESFLNSAALSRKLSSCLQDSVLFHYDGNNEVLQKGPMWCLSTKGSL